MPLETSTDAARVFLKTSWFFQVLITTPVFLQLGFRAMDDLFYSYYGIYRFIACLCNAVFAAGILFVLAAQRQIPNPSKLLTWRLELAKAVLASAMWIWLLFDAIWGPRRYYEARFPRIVSSAASVIVLLLFFVPTAIYAYMNPRGDEEVGDVENTESRVADERTPLLEGRG